MIIGFTGTQLGLSTQQLDQLTLFVEHWRDEITEAHHGDCIGADMQFHDIIWEQTTAKIEIHPPLFSAKRAWCGTAVVGSPRLLWHPPVSYLKRNYAIVDACNGMLAGPYTMEEQLRSGTWATIRYARKQDKRVILLER